MNKDYFKTMSEYNAWINSKVFAICSGLDESVLKEDRQLYFKSIHGTLNHILLADKVWMGRFEGTPFPVRGLDQELCADFDELQNEREAMDQRIRTYISNLNEAILSTDISYTSLVNPEPRTYPYSFALMHFFNHQTHHRGQVYAVLSQLGIDYGVTDLIWLSN